MKYFLAILALVSIWASVVVVLWGTLLLAHALSGENYGDGSYTADLIFVGFLILYCVAYKLGKMFTDDKVEKGVITKRLDPFRGFVSEEAETSGPSRADPP